MSSDLSFTHKVSYMLYCFEGRGRRLFEETWSMCRATCQSYITKHPMCFTV